MPETLAPTRLRPAEGWWIDLILIAGGLFLVWKATTEIHDAVTPRDPADAEPEDKRPLGFASAIVQILFLDMVFSFDSILTAVGTTGPPFGATAPALPVTLTAGRTISVPVSFAPTSPGSFTGALR